MLFLRATALGERPARKEVVNKPSVCLWMGVRREPEEEELCSPAGVEKRNSEQWKEARGCCRML